MAEVKLVIVYGDRGPGTITYRRHDTLKEVSCVDCSAFTDEGQCMLKICHPWPLGSKVCSLWQLRTEPHAMKKCAGKWCHNEIPVYYRHHDWCSDTCEWTHDHITGVTT